MRAPCHSRRAGAHRFRALHSAPRPQARPRWAGTPTTSPATTGHSVAQTIAQSQDTPKQTATGTVPAGGGKVTFEIDKTDPQNPTGNRFTGERFEKALNVTLNSVVFRSSGQDLTTTGTYIEMTSRLTEPVLLGLAVLAIRNRVKR
ncbi:hypothetical protein QF030_000030 [Streptomyces rishiriensis]|uniref:Uncharacterized protein n=1 Tax=Streptomyces rishiriensis TaxID=68264 RepID=A0ABU0NFH0_STRRH|nr:hypothetical protein [Streptomyces rishiriensis]